MWKFVTWKVKSRHQIVWVIERILYTVSPIGMYVHLCASIHAYTVLGIVRPRLPFYCHAATIFKRQQKWSTSASLPWVFPLSSYLVWSYLHVCTNMSLHTCFHMHLKTALLSFSVGPFTSSDQRSGGQRALCPRTRGRGCTFCSQEAPGLGWVQHSFTPKHQNTKCGPCCDSPTYPLTKVLTTWIIHVPEDHFCLQGSFIFYLFHVQSALFTGSALHKQW